MSQHPSLNRPLLSSPPPPTTTTTSIHPSLRPSLHLCSAPLSPCHRLIGGDVTLASWGETLLRQGCGDSVISPPEHTHTHTWTRTHTRTPAHRDAAVHSSASGCRGDVGGCTTGTQPLCHRLKEQRSPASVFPSFTQQVIRTDLVIDGVYNILFTGPSLEMNPSLPISTALLCTFCCILKAQLGRIWISHRELRTGAALELLIGLCDREPRKFSPISRTFPPTPERWFKIKLVRIFGNSSWFKKKKNLRVLVFVVLRAERIS